MAITQNLSAYDVGRRLADEISQDPAARGLWARNVRDYVELWLLTEPIDADTERRLYSVAASLYDWFPGAYIRFSVVNPRLFDEETELVGDVIPSKADSIWLRS